MLCVLALNWITKVLSLNEQLIIGLNRNELVSQAQTFRLPSFAFCPRPGQLPDKYGSPWQIFHAQVHVAVGLTNFAVFGNIERFLI